MGAAGSPHATFQRAISRRNLTVALAVARELPMVTLADALALTLLILERDPPRGTASGGAPRVRFASPDYRDDTASPLAVSSGKPREFRHVARECRAECLNGRLVVAHQVVRPKMVGAGERNNAMFERIDD